MQLEIGTREKKSETNKYLVFSSLQKRVVASNLLIPRKLNLRLS